ncbi:MAG: methyltransferase domain-containing protein [Acidimicrobiales bacterium]
MSPEAERRQDRERQFHDDLFSKEAGGRGEAGRFYAIVQRSQDAYWSAVEARAPGADCIEYGCSYGLRTIRAAESAASAVGMDISPVAVEKARRAAQDAGSPARFEVAEAENLPFGDHSFDLAFGSGVLHHLELEPAVAEMCRVLRPSGAGVFSEPLGHNRLINWYRNRTPGMRTPDEHPLVRSDFDLFRDHFAEVRVDFFHLAALASVILVGKPGFRPLFRALDKVDDYLLTALPPLHYQAWVCVMVLQGPKRG